MRKPNSENAGKEKNGVTSLKKKQEMDMSCWIKIPPCDRVYIKNIGQFTFEELDSNTPTLLGDHL